MPFTDGSRHRCTAGMWRDRSAPASSTGRSFPGPAWSWPSVATATGRCWRAAWTFRLSTGKVRLWRRAACSASRSGCATGTDRVSWVRPPGSRGAAYPPSNWTQTRGAAATCFWCRTGGRWVPSRDESPHRELTRTWAGCGSRSRAPMRTGASTSAPTARALSRPRSPPGATRRATPTPDTARPARQWTSVPEHAARCSWRCPPARCLRARRARTD